MQPVGWLDIAVLNRSILLKFSLETRLENMSFEALIDFLVFHK